MTVTTRKSLKNGHALASDWVKIKDAFAQTGDAFSDSVDGIKNKTVRAQKQVSAYTVRRPLKSLGIAVLVGVSIGIILKRIL